ncbi:SET domain-containing protein-lysine N-methyltransferase [Hymenobacter sedentarius]|uniref:SET domain-containing protein-lysine N-methyltransferase n=1 Tax=Hymenobacter sedentarius TaxID=1411621 RepID=A0A0U3SJH9_9BACT|nr:SET domain-containing protein [Hymenobacter sedentarius]ALW86276.1 SET domain-containing protein-lysine N-methyltransferase [Hymenobacter sedentarius]
MIHPDTELRFISPEIGFGVVATKLIPKGTITWVFDSLDQIISPEKLERMDSMQKVFLEKYCYRDHTGNYVLCGDHARFVNHSFRSSCMSTAYDCEVAVRDILPGEELTDDYGYLNPSEPFDCVPEEGCTRTRVLPDDLLNFHPEWDAQLREAFENFSSVEQPLLHMLASKYRAKVLAVAAGQASMDSILNCYYDASKVRKE